ncbi:MAG: immune inhibitor A [Candidatus Latescibacteria bacterium]|nr:immune inhibitor A [Candidatus Latescibacterota bacterium]
MKSGGIPRIALLLLLAGAQGGWALVCGEGAARPAQGHLSSRGHLQALAVFARFQDEDQSERTLPEFAASLFDPQRPGSLTHFYLEMSQGQFRLDGEVAPHWYGSRRPASAYVDSTGLSGEFSAFTREILAALDAEVDLGRYDDDGADGVPNSGDDDGYVDFLFLNTLTIPRNFIVADATGVAGLGLGDDYLTADRRLNGGFIRIRADGHPRGRGGTLQRAHTFEVAVGSMAHEFGHALGLPDLYDLDYGQQDGIPDPEKDSAGVGYWCLMGRGALGWDEQGGPNPFCAWSLGQLGWIGADNAALVVVQGQFEGARLEDVRTGGAVYQLPVSGDAEVEEYLLLEHRRTGTSYYERLLPASGLLIWRVRSSKSELGPGIPGGGVEFGSNNAEEAKLVDLVCADGLYLDAGFPAGTRPAPERGRDNLDFWAHDEAYRAAHFGNLGDATDLFDGANFTEYSAITNPAPPPGISVSRIRRQGEAMLADLSAVDRRRAGSVAGTQTWKDTVEVVGDVVVEPGARLHVAPGTLVRFDQDHRRQGVDPQRCELVVQGELIVGRQARFSSAAASPQPGDWYGIALHPAGQLILRQATLEYPQQGVSGRGLLSPLAIEDSRILQAGQCGICLEEIQEIVTLLGVEVEGAGQEGVRVTGPAQVRVRGARLEGNGAKGLERVGGYLECLGSQFADNGSALATGADLVLGGQVFGRVANNQFRGEVGIRCEQCEDVLIEQNRLAGHRIGLHSDSGRPHLVRNEFIGDELALLLTGLRVPARLELNAVENAGQLLDNQTGIEVVARNNWWGRDDEAWIQAHLKGLVQWRPFLNFDPRIPVTFSLSPNYPNPFNGSTVIEYTVGINKAALDLQSEIVVEVRSLAGGLVRQLVRQPSAPGIYSVVWDGRDQEGQPVASGVYCCQLKVNPVLVSRKLLVLR